MDPFPTPAQLASPYSLLALPDSLRLLLTPKRPGSVFPTKTAIASSKFGVYISHEHHLKGARLVGAQKPYQPCVDRDDQPWDWEKINETRNKRLGTLTLVCPAKPLIAGLVYFLYPHRQ